MLRHCLFTDPQRAVHSVAMRGFVEYVCDCFWICLIFFVEWIHPNGNIYSPAHACQIFQALAFFPLLFFLCYLDGLFCCGQMPPTWFLSCWAHWWSALNILLSILWAIWALVHKCRFCKKKAKTIWVGQKKSFLMSRLVCHRFHPWCVWLWCMKSSISRLCLNTLWRPALALFRNTK